MKKNAKTKKPNPAASAEKEKKTAEKAVEAEEKELPEAAEDITDAETAEDAEDAENSEDTEDNDSAVETDDNEENEVTDSGNDTDDTDSPKAERSPEDETVGDLLRERFAPVFKFGAAAVTVMQRMDIFDKFLVRFIAVFFFFSGLNAAMLKKSEIYAVSKWREYIPEVKMGTSVMLMIAAFVIISFICYLRPKKDSILDEVLAIAAILYFDITLLWRCADFNFSMGMMFVSCVLVYYCLNKMKSGEKMNKIPWWLCGIVVLIVTGFVAYFIALTTCSKHQNFGTAAHDFGLFVQMYHSLANNGTAVTSCERDTLMSHFKIHASYIFYLLVPFFKMFPKPETLLISQAILSMGGIVPMFLIAKRRKMKGVTLIFMCLAYTFCIGLVAPCYYEFHENAFLPTILMWLLWAVDSKNYVMFFIMSVLTCIVKEDAPLYVVSIAMFMVFEHKEKKSTISGLIMAVVSTVYMFYITAWLTKNGDGQMMMSTRFSILMLDETAGLKEVIKNVLIDPAYLISLLFRDDTRIFFFQVMVPFLFIPFFTKKIHRYLLMVPFIVMNLVIGAGYGYAANVGFQYIFGPATLLVYLCLINIDDMSDKNKLNVPIVLGTAAMVMTIGSCSHYLAYRISHKNDEAYYHSLDALLDSIPKDATVGCDTFLVAHVADHEGVYIFDSYDIREDGTLTTTEKFEFVVLPVLSDMYEYWSDTLVNNGYTLFDEISGRYQVFKSPTYVLK